MIFPDGPKVSDSQRDDNGPIVTIWVRSYNEVTMLQLSNGTGGCSNMGPDTNIRFTCAGRLSISKSCFEERANLSIRNERSGKATSVLVATVAYLGFRSRRGTCRYYIWRGSIAATRGYAQYGDTVAMPDSIAGVVGCLFAFSLEGASPCSRAGRLPGGHRGFRISVRGCLGRPGTYC